MGDLLNKSIQIILHNQSPSGAYLASPDFPTYHYSWFRDGAFIAYAMDLVGEHASAARFHDWAAGVVNQHAKVARRAVRLAKNGEPLGANDFLHTRYTVGGEEAGGEEWPNFQLDGFGTWLWALGEHLCQTGSALPPAWRQAAGLAADYLAALWQRPCFDCWEEYPEHVHPHTLAAIYGGLQGHAALSGHDHHGTLHDIAEYLQKRAITGGHFVKYIGSDTVDASLIGLATPYRVVDPVDPLMRQTIACIESTLVRGGGVHRYPADSYYGGGEWVLLAAWLGWYYCEIGEFDRARSILAWIEAQADENGHLPEQVPLTLNDPNNYLPWVRRWGPVANPLLWSHAKYIILRAKLGAS